MRRFWTASENRRGKPQYPVSVKANSQAREQGKQNAEEQSQRYSWPACPDDGRRNGIRLRRHDHQEAVGRASVMRQAEAEANKLLAIDPDATGRECRAGDEQLRDREPTGSSARSCGSADSTETNSAGSSKCSSAAEHGHHLQPFAKIMLALAYEREHKRRMRGNFCRQLA